MPVEQAAVAPRRSRGLSDIAPQYVAKSGLCSVESDSPRSSLRVRQMSGSPSANQEESRFPRLDQCAHFHYDHVDLPPLQVCLYRDEMKQRDAGNNLHAVQVTSHGCSWLVRRSYENFRLLDAQLHRCVYDRRFSELTELPEQPGDEVLSLLDCYLLRFSSLSGNLLNCGPVLNWLELDNRGRRLLAADVEDCPINTPAVAAAYGVRRYSAQAVDEISFQVGDMISVIDMPPAEDSVWWRGKLGFQVGFFPGACVAVIGDKLPRSLKLPHPMQTSVGMSEPSKPVLKKHGKLIAFFRSFILARPSRRRLKQSGILKERVFGCDLGEHLLNSGHEVPMVLKCCAEFIESHGIVDGIYRLSGVTSNIQKLRNAFDEDRIPALYEDATILQDIHSVASLLKMYFRELPNPLCTYQLYRAFVAAAGAPKHNKLAMMRGAVAHLPPPHYRTLNYLMGHLARVAERGHVTGMTARNVAIVWAPNLLRCKELEVGGVAALQGVGIQAVVTEFLICYQDLIFCDKLPALSALPPILASPKRCRPKSLAISTPTKLLSLEEARARAVGSAKPEADYIEVGGGPSQLPAKYHTVIELPRKRAAKRSPLGWRSLFKSTRKSSGKSTAPCGLHIDNQPLALTEADILYRHRLRPVKSAESLSSSSIQPAPEQDKATSEASLRSQHNRSVSHDSYFDTLDTPVHRHKLRSSLLLEMSEDNANSSLDLSEIQLNFDLEDSEMRIFSEDETLVSTSVGSTSLASNNSPRICRLRQALPCHKRLTQPPRAREEDSVCGSVDPSPKKLKTSNTSPTDSTRSKRSRLEEQLVSSTGELRFIDSQSPDNTVVVEAEVHPTSRYSHSDSTPDTPYAVLVEDNCSCSTATSTPLSDTRQTVTESGEARMSQSSSLDFPYNRLSVPCLSPNSSVSNLTPTVSSLQEQDSSPEQTFLSGKTYENVPVFPVTPEEDSRTHVDQEQALLLERPYENVPGYPESLVKESRNPEEAFLLERPYENVPGYPESPVKESRNPEEAFLLERPYENVPTSSGLPESPVKESRITISYGKISSPEPRDDNIYQNLSREEERFEKNNVYQNLPSPSQVKTPDNDNVYENVEVSSSESPTFGRDSSPPSSRDSPEVVYERVKYFRHSVEQVNQLLDTCAVGDLVKLDDSPRQEIGSGLAQEILDALDFRSGLLLPDSGILQPDVVQTQAVLQLEQVQSHELEENSDELEVKSKDFQVKNDDFVDFEVKNYDFTEKSEDFFDFEVKNNVLEEKGDDFKVKSDDFHVKNDDFVDFEVKGDDFEVKSNDFEVKSDISSPAEDFGVFRGENEASGFEPHVPPVETGSAPVEVFPERRESLEEFLGSDPVRRRIESEIGRDIVRDRRMRQELEDIRSSKKQTGIKELLSRFEPASPTKSGSVWDECKSPSPTKDKSFSPRQETRAFSPTKASSPGKERPDFKAISPTKEITRSKIRSDLKSNSPSKSPTSPIKETMKKFSSRESTPKSPTKEFFPISPTKAFVLASPPREVFKVTLASGDFQATLPSREFQRKDSTDETPKLNRRYGDAGSLPPCLRARAARSARNAASLSGSLDEDRFVAVNEDMARVLTSPDIAAEGSGLQGVLKPLNATDVDDAQRRARIEKYKEERRSFLREKYRSESFKAEKDEIVSRLKQKAGKVAEETEETAKKSSSKSRLKSTESETSVLEKREDKFFRIRNLSKSPDKSRPEPITCVTVKERQSCDKMNVRLSDVTDRQSCEKNVRLGEVKRSADRRYSSPNARDEPVRGSAVRSSPTSPTKRPSSVESQPEATRRKSAGSPAYCIKDMAAMFETRDKPPGKQYMSSV